MKGNSNQYLVAAAVVALISLAAGIVSGATVTQNITYQGKLTDASGIPLTGTYSVRFSLYAASTGGTALATETHMVQSSNGLFDTTLTFTPSLFDGQALWLGIKVGSDPEMTPRQEIRPVPYALGLRTGAVGTSLTTNRAGTGYSQTVPGLNILTTHTWNPGVRINTTSDSSYGIMVTTSGTYSSGINSYVYSSHAHGVQGFAYGTTSSNGVNGWSVKGTGVNGESISGTGISGTGLNETGVKGSGKTGVSGESISGTGVYGRGKTGGNFTTIQAGTLSNPLPAVNLYTQYSRNPGARVVTKGDFSEGVSIDTAGTSSNGVTVKSTGDNSIGVYASSLKSVGMYGDSASNDGVLGVSVTAPGIHGISTSGRGVYGESTSGPGVFGTSTSMDGVTGGSTSLYGVSGYSTNNAGVFGQSGTRVGVKGEGPIGVAGVAYSGGTGLLASDPGDGTGKAAIFQGNVVIKNSAGSTNLLEFGEGLDYSEGFDIANQDTVTPGTVLVISPDDSGTLTASSEPYDRKVAGIVAGANGLGSAVRVGGDEFDASVALAGRVYCNVDTTYGAVKAGDMLTTSATPGYAMVVQDHARAQGATIGKAMQGLEEGQKGQILVLVTLQ